MPQIVTTTVFTIDELSDAAREKARTWYREEGLFDEWYDYIYDDFETICRIIGITLQTSPVRLYGGGTRDRTHIWFRGYADNRTMPRSPLKAWNSPTAMPALSAYSKGFIYKNAIHH